MAPNPSSEVIVPGTRLGKYEVVHRIAFGGMAEIYLARVSGIQGFEKYVVLKRILPHYAENEELVRMFLKEARVAAGLDHPNIAHVHDIGEQGGVFFFTMEYLHGEDVRTIMRELTRREEKVPLEHALAIVIGAASGLHFAHERRGTDGRELGIVHRDMSPSNVVVTFAGSVKVVDFGVAKIAADPELSRRYSLKGKLSYMSPEQLQSRPVDRRSDVFSLGIVLYEITTHSRLFKAPTEVDTIRMVLDASVPRPSTRCIDYPPELERIVMRALDPEPETRYQTARELLQDLETFARDLKLQVSSSSLANWMESTFGPKRELWHTLPAPGTGASSPGLSVSQSQSLSLSQPADGAATVVVSHHNMKRPLFPANDIPVDITIHETPAPRPRRKLALAAGALVALLAVAGGVLALRQHASAKPTRAEAAAAGGSTVLVVAEGGNVAVEHRAAPPAQAAAPPAQVAPPPAPAAPPPPEPSAPGAEAPRRGHAARAARTAPRGESFSTTFARREGDIRRCFADVAERPDRGNEIALRFQAGRDGHVTSVSVLPEALAATNLGACLTRVGRSTVFAPQEEPVTFRIPLTVQLQSSPAPSP